MHPSQEYKENIDQNVNCPMHTSDQNAQKN